MTKSIVVCRNCKHDHANGLLACAQAIMLEGKEIGPCGCDRYEPMLKVFAVSRSERKGTWLERLLFVETPATRRVLTAIYALLLALFTAYAMSGNVH